MATVEAAGASLRVEESGAGPAVLLAHGAADGLETWSDALAQAPSLRLRAIALDRRGYGGSTAPEPYGRTTVGEQAEDLAAVLTALEAVPAVVVGVDLAALAALDLAQRHRRLVRALVLVDAPAVQLVPDATEALSAERDALEAAVREGGPARAVEAWLAERGVDDPKRLERAARSAPTFFADLAGQATLPLARRELRALDLPVVVLDGPGTPAHVRAACDALAALLPTARRGGADEDVARTAFALAGAQLRDGA